MKQSQSTIKKNITVTDFGVLPTGEKNKLFTLTNANGISMSVMNYGGIITALFVPDRNGVLADIVLGYDSLKGYLEDSPYFGALIGRYGNRIRGGRFSLDGKEYSLATNNGANHLHGGVKGFDKVFWNIEELEVEDGAALKLTYVSKDGDEGYPGTLTTEVVYHLTDTDELRINYKATTDKKTIVNLTQHTYFNLSGTNKDILSHQLIINADRYLPVDETLIPTEVADVKETPFDFRESTLIGQRIDQRHEQLRFGKGYDHCWILNRKGENRLEHAATLSDSATGRQVEVFTTEPGIQFYSGNFLDGSIKGKGGNVYQFRTGLCLETQHFPDSPNRTDFPNVTLMPGEQYSSETIYRFGIMR